MKQSNIKLQDLSQLKKGVHVWIQEYDTNGIPTRLRTAEVLGVSQASAYCNDTPYVIVHYLDEGTSMYECISPAQIEGFCTEETL